MTRPVARSLHVGLFAVALCSASTALLGQTGSLALSSGSVAAGGSITLNLNWTAPATSVPAGLQWTFAYAPASISSITPTAGPALTAAGKTLNCNAANGTVICLATGMNANTIGTGVVATVSVVLPPGIAGSSVPIAVGNLFAVLADGTSATITGTGGTISVLQPVPSIISLLPATALAGGLSFTLTVNGAGFTPSSVVNWNGGARTTTFVSATQLQVTVTALDILLAITAQITVSNPAPGGGTSGNSAFTVTATNAVPTISSLSPSSATAGTAAFTLTINGTGFLNGSIVRWNGSNRTTTFVSGTQLQAAITAADIGTAGTGQVTVFNPAPGGGTSGNAAFTISATNPIPTVSSLSPSSATAGTAAFTLTVNGTGFLNGSVVNWNGASRTTTFVSATQLQAAITAADIATAGTGQVTVFSPAPGGGTSSNTAFTISAANPIPTISSLSPSSATAGTAAFTLTVNGTGFLNGSVVNWNGTSRTTTFVSATQLQAAITAADITTAGTAQVTVFNPAPGGGTSSNAAFTISTTNPIPTVSSLSPSSATAGTAAFTVTVNGTGFLNGSVVNWNGTNRTTTFVSATQLQAAITAADITTAGTAQVTVFNPAPGGGTSSNAAFTISAPGTAPTAGLIGYWNYDEGSGTIAHDTSGSGYNGTVVSASWTAGKVNSGVSLNGTTSYVVTSNIPLSSAFSVSTWVNSAVSTQAGYTRIAETQYSAGFYLGTNDTGAKYKFIVNSGTGSTGTCGKQFGCAEGGSVTTGWHLVTGTFDGSTAQLYVDNILVASDTFRAPNNVSFPLYIGRNFASSVLMWNGGIDETRLYNRALSGAEVSSIFAAAGGTGGTGDTTPPTVSITTPTVNATVSGTITVMATAADNVGISDVQFQLDGVNVGADMTGPPYSMSWNTTTSSNATHNLTAIARDAAHNATTSTTVQVTVNNAGAPTAGLIGYWNYDEGSGTIAHDISGSGFTGTVVGASWTAGKINSGLSLNGTTSYVVTPNIPLSSAFSVSTWVNSAVSTQAGYTRIAETQYSAGFYLGTNDTGAKYKFIVNSGTGSTGTCGKSFGCAEGGSVTIGWHLVTGTFDGSTAQLYVDNVLVASDTFRAPNNVSFPLYIGRNFASSVLMWNGGIDETRLYNRALSGAEVSAIFGSTGGTGGGTDTTPPTTPTGVSATAVSSSQINVSWGASSDNVGVTGYRVYRNGTMVGTPITLSYSDTGLTAATSYSYTVIAIDGAGNASTPSTAASATTSAAADTIPPTVSITTPTVNATVSGTITVMATAADNVGVSDVQFQLDGVNVGADMTAPPYSISWNTMTSSNSTHNLTAIARDAAHNATTSTTVQVTVNNVTAPTAGLIGYWNYDEGGGTIAHDTSGSGFTGTVVGASWVTGKINSGLGLNGTTSYVVTSNIPLSSAFSVSTWVNSAVSTQAGYTRIAETQYSAGLYLGTNDTGAKYKFIVNSGTGSTGTCGKMFGCAEGGSVTIGWHLVTGTFDGSTAQLYVDNVLVASDTFRAPNNVSFPLYIGRNFASSVLMWNGGIDETRLYNRALSSGEVSAIFGSTGGTGGTTDSTPPTTPTGVSATAVSSSQINVSWSASSDNVGVTGYRVYRNGTMVGTPITLSYSDTGLTAATSYSYTVIAIDGAGNASTPSTAASATTSAAADTTPPTVSIATPTANATVSGTITVTATAADNVGVSDVQFQLDGVNVGADMTAPPYSISWNTTTSSNATHNLTAIARDAAHNAATSTTVQVMVNNVTAPTAGLIGNWNYDEGSGTIAHDTSGSGFTGTVVGASWVTGRINSGLSLNGTTSYVVTPNIPLSSAFSVSTWVNSAVTTQAGYTRIAETQYSAGLYLGTNDTGAKYKFIVNSGTGSTGTCGKMFGCAEGGSVTIGWHLVTGTFDGSTAQLYVDNVLVASDTFRAPNNVSFPLYIGRNFASNVLMWNGGIDETRLYNRALSGTEVSSIFAYTGGPAGGPADTTPPTTPTGVFATAVSSSQINVAWSASGDNIGVTGYRVFRNGVLVGAPTTPSYSDTGLAGSTTYSYTVTAVDAAGNASTPSTAASATTLVPTDTTPPTVSITTPGANATVSATVTLTASASDNVGVTDVQFRLDGVNLGADLTAPPYTISWNTSAATDGIHSLSAIARDAAHNATTATIQVTVNNAAAAVPTAGLIGYWNFDEGAGTTAHDISGSGYNGTVNGAVWGTGKTNSGLSFNGTTSYVVTPNISLSAFSVSTWINPAVTTQAGYTRIAETQYSAGFFLGTNSTGTKFKFIVNSATGSTAGCGLAFGCTEGGILTSGWHLVTGTYDGVTAKLYVDNILVASDTFTAPVNANFPLYFGRYFAGNGFNWNGGIDEVRLYNRALTLTEVGAIFNH